MNLSDAAIAGLKGELSLILFQEVGLELVEHGLASLDPFAVTMPGTNAFTLTENGRAVALSLRDQTECPK